MNWILGAMPALRRPEPSGYGSFVETGTKASGEVAAVGGEGVGLSGAGAWAATLSGGMAGAAREGGDAGLAGAALAEDPRSPAAGRRATQLGSGTATSPP